MGGSLKALSTNTLTGPAQACHRCAVRFCACTSRMGNGASLLTGSSGMSQVGQAAQMPCFLVLTGSKKHIDFALNSLFSGSCPTVSSESTRSVSLHSMHRHTTTCSIFVATCSIFVAVFSLTVHQYLLQWCARQSVLASVTSLEVLHGLGWLQSACIRLSQALSRPEKSLCFSNHSMAGRQCWHVCTWHAVGLFMASS